MSPKDRVMRIARSLGGWQPSYVFGACALSVLAYALVAADHRAASRLFAGTVAPLVYGVGVGGLAVFAACMVAVRKATTFRYLLAFHTIVAAFLISGYRLRLETDLLLVLLSVLWALLFEPFPTCLVLSCVGALLLPATMLLEGSSGVLAPASLALAGIVEATLGSFLIRAHERTIELQKYSDRLEENVASLTRANILSQNYAKDIELESQAKERDRLTRDIHDAIGYTLTNTIMMMEAVKVMVRTEPDRVPAHVKRMRVATEEGLASIKRILRDFRTREQKAESVFWAVKKLVKVFCVSTGLAVRYEIGNADTRDLERFPDAVYHFIQEGLINAFRHGHATRVAIILWDYGDRLRIVLDDDGKGSPGGFTPGIGITGMQERAALAGGSVSVDRVEPGYRISMHLPLGKRDGEEDQAADRG